METLQGDVKIELLEELLKSFKRIFFAPNTEILDVPPADTQRLIHGEYKSLGGAIRKYEVLDLDSFINYCKEQIEPNIGGIFINYQEIKGLHDIRRPNLSYLVYRFVESQQLKDWLSVEYFNQKQLREFLETRLAEFEPTTLFEELAKLKLNAHITYNADMDDDLNYRLVFEEKQAKGASQIPKKITVNVPIYENRPPRELVFRVRFTQPKNNGEKPLFSLEPIGLKQILREEMQEMAEVLAKDLSDYRIYFGSPNCSI